MNIISPNPASAAVAPIEEIPPPLDRPKPDQHSGSPGRDFAKIVNRLSHELNRIDAKTDRQLNDVAPEARKLLQLQIDVNKVTIDTQLAVKAAETVTGSVRQLQQLANG